MIKNANYLMKVITDSMDLTRFFCQMFSCRGQRHFVYRKTIQYIVNRMHCHFIDRLAALVVELFDIVNTLYKLLNRCKKVN